MYYKQGYDKHCPIQAKISETDEKCFVEKIHEFSLKVKWEFYLNA